MPSPSSPTRIFASFSGIGHRGEREIQIEPVQIEADAAAPSEGIEKHIDALFAKIKRTLRNVTGPRMVRPTVTLWPLLPPGCCFTGVVRGQAGATGCVPDRATGTGVDRGRPTPDSTFCLT